MDGSADGERPATGQSNAIEETARAIRSASKTNQERLSTFERLQARSTALEAFRRGLITEGELGEINRSIDQYERARRRGARRRARESPTLDTGTDGQPPNEPSGTDWQGEASRGREAMERELAARPLKVPVEFSIAGSEIEDAALMRGS